MEGVELSAKAKEIMPDLKIIGMSGGGVNLGSRHVQNIAGRYFELFLIKPFKRVELLEAVESLIGGSCE